MIETISFFLNNIKIREPENWRELSIELNFDKENPRAKLKLNDWSFVIENAHIINEWVESGLTGGVGIFEGIPVRIELDNGVIETIFDGYLDLTDNTNFSCSEVTTTSIEKLGMDWLNDNADGFTFEYLAQINKITKANYIFQPYVNSSVPNYTESATAIIGVFVIINELRAQSAMIASLIISAANPLEFTAIIRAIAWIIYTLTLIAALIKLIYDLSTLLIQPVKYHAGMKAKDLFHIGCDHLKIGFKSSIFDDPDMANLVIIPEKYSLPTNVNKLIVGFTQPNTGQDGFYKGTFGNFIRDMKLLFNAKIMMVNGVLIFERRDNMNGGTPKYTIPDIYNIWHKLNTSEFNSSFVLEFKIDPVERNTMQEYQGTGYEVILQPIVVNNEHFRLTKGLKTVVFPFSLAKQKRELTLPEELIKDCLDVVSVVLNILTTGINAVIKLFNVVIKIINKTIKSLGVVGIKLHLAMPQIPLIPKFSFGNFIEDRKGMMILSSDFIGVPKAYIIKEGATHSKNKIATNNDVLMSAKHQWDNYYYIDSFVPSPGRPTANQYKLREIDNAIFKLSDYQKIKSDNYALDTEGKTSEIDSLEWFFWDQKAKINYRTPFLYSSNLKETKYEPTGK